MSSPDEPASKLQDQAAKRVVANEEITSKSHQHPLKRLLKRGLAEITDSSSEDARAAKAPAVGSYKPVMFQPAATTTTSAASTSATNTPNSLESGSRTI